MATIAIDVQVLLGFVLYLAVSPYSRSPITSFDAELHARELRFWTMEHPVAMLCALAFAHLTKVRLRRVHDKHMLVLLGLGVTLVLVVIGIPWPFGPVPRPL